jgi:Chaperone of endosialidase
VVQYTSKLSLYKPGGGLTGTNTPDEVADIDKLNYNFDVIDARMGVTICTSASRPSAPYAGQSIYESNTGLSYTWDGFGWRKVTAVIVSDDIASGAITEAKLADAAVTGTKIADASISASKIVPGAVGTDEIGDGQVTDAKLATNAVTTTKILAGAVTQSKIATNLIARYSDGPSPDAYNATTGTAANTVMVSTWEWKRLTSSLKYKTNIQDYDGADAVLQLRPVIYDRYNGETNEIGFIAEEVVEHIPHAGVLFEGEVDNYNDRALLASLVSLVQRQQKEIDALREAIG